MSLTTQDKQDIKVIVGEAFKENLKTGIAHLPTIDIVRDVVREETAHLPSVDRVRDIVKEETAHLPTVEIVRDIVHEEIHSEIKPLDERVGKLEESAADYKAEIYKLGVMIEDNKSETFRLGVIIEDIDSRLRSVAEAVGNYLKLSNKVDRHELRLEDIESIQPMIIETLKLHSKKLNTI